MCGMFWDQKTSKIIKPGSKESSPGSLSGLAVYHMTCGTLF